MPLVLKTFNDLLTEAQNTLTNAAPTKVNNFRAGSIAYALTQSLVGNTLSQELLIAKIYATERLASSFNSDVDSFVGDYGMTRTPALPATGTVTLTRTQSNSVQGVNVGGVIQTAQSGIPFTIIPDNNQAAYNPVLGLYQFQPGQLTIDVTVQCNQVGALGNINANTLTSSVSGIIGVTSMTNGERFTDGSDQELDPALKKRFILFIGSLQSANVTSIENAIESVQPNVTYQLMEYLHFDSSPFVAGFTAVVDDGTGQGNVPFLTAVSMKIDAVRAAGAEFVVIAPTNVAIVVSMHVTAAAGVAPAVAQANVTAAVQAYIEGLGVGVNVSLGGVENSATGAQGVYAITSLTLNGGAADVSIAINQLGIAPNTVTFI